MATILGADIECLTRKCHTAFSMPLKEVTVNLFHFGLNTALVQARVSSTLLTAADQGIPVRTSEQLFFPRVKPISKIFPFLLVL